MLNFYTISTNCTLSTGPLKILNLNYAFVNRNRDKKPSF